MQQIIKTKYKKILICGLRCTGKTTLFWNLQRNLNWPTLSTSKFLMDFVRTNGLADKPKEIEKLHPEMSQQIDDRTISLLKGNNNCIIETRLFAHNHLKFPDTFTLLLTCDTANRLNRYTHRECTTLDKAKKRLIQRERKWLERIKKIYQREHFFKHKNFDLVIDTTNLTPKQVLMRVIKNIQQY
jgi:cytidylate kinase